LSEFSALFGVVGKSQCLLSTAKGASSGTFLHRLRNRTVSWGHRKQEEEGLSRCLGLRAWQALQNCTCSEAPGAIFELPAEGNGVYSKQSTSEPKKIIEITLYDNFIIINKEQGFQ